MDELDEFFEDPKNRGIASGAELASLVGCSEGFVREFGRNRDTRRVGSTLVYNRDDADALLAELEDEEVGGDDDGDDDEDGDDDDGDDDEYDDHPDDVEP